MIKDLEKVLLTKTDIENICIRLGKQITKDYQNTDELILIGLLKGCNPFMGDLAKEIALPIQLEYMVVSSYQGSKSTHHIDIKYDPKINITNKDILIVEDIVDTGYTVSAVSQLLNNRKAKSVKVVSLLDKPEGRLTHFDVDYIGYTIPKAFVVGYGLDYNQRYRNLSCIGILKPSIYQKEEENESRTK